MFSQLEEIGWMKQIGALVIAGAIAGFGSGLIQDADFSEVTDPPETASKEDLAALVAPEGDQKATPEGAIATPKDVTFLDIMSELYGRDDVTFIDARDEPTYEAGHILGAIPLDAERVETDKNYGNDRIGKIPKTQVLIVYCSGGDCDLSHRLARNLIARGFKKLLVYTGGWPEWVSEGGDKEEGPYQPKGTEG